MNFTDDQKKIIESRNENLLVSAAAGSGKTAVMVERIVSLITDENNPVDIDSFLVVTFTRAAAAQMREKISKRIEELLAKDPENEHLQRQTAIIHNAQITTIDAFCLYVLRNSFSQIDLDPGFRLADEGELKLIREDVLSEVIEKYYSEASEEFASMVDSLCTGTDDSELNDYIIKLYNMAMSTPWPEDWCKERLNDYKADESGHLSGFWYDFVIKKIGMEIKGAYELASKALEYAVRPDGPYMYGDNIENERDAIKKVYDYIEENSDIPYDELRSKLQAILFEKLPPCRDKSVNADIKDRASNLRKTYKKAIEDILKKYLNKSEDAHLYEMKKCCRTLTSLVDITLEFKKAYDEAMRDKGVLSFSDCEHLALNILVRPVKLENGEIAAEYTETAKEYRKHFKYVLIDEYQDSNYIQELILSAVSGESEGSFNRFMVGDVKQSIYRFRQANPEIFINKYDEYSKELVGKRLIDLHQNFRSRSQVLDFTNEIFKRLMSRQLGGVTYDDTAALHKGAVYPEDIDGRFNAELALIETDAEDDSSEEDTKRTDSKLTPRELEAKMIALKINALMHEMKVKDENASNGELAVRNLKYSDIVILLRSQKTSAKTYEKILTEYGIPVHLSGTAGYFSTYEIRTLMHLLRIIVNPLQDISFYGVMVSVIGGFDDKDIALIRAHYIEEHGRNNVSGEPYLYNACKNFAENETVTNASLQNKVRSFINMLDTFRLTAEYLPTEKLLWSILEETDYRTYVYAMKGGEGRLANVDMLLRKAEDYSKTSYSGLHNFVRYVDLLEKYEIDDAESETLDEKADVVRIMSIHKSKGLEFPVCFVADINKKINTRDAYDFLTIDGDLGVGIDDINVSKRTKSGTLRKRAITDKIILESVSEELRVLYVALTRAMEKLILTGAVRGFLDRLTKLEDSLGKGEISPNQVLCDKGYLEWILMCMASSGAAEGITAQLEKAKTLDAFYLPDLCMSVSYMQGSELEEETLKQSIDYELLKKEVEVPKKIDDSPYINYLNDLFAKQYMHPELSGLYAKTSVSELKKAAMPEETEAVFELINSGIDSEKEEYVPHFISGNTAKPGATVRGSAFHRVLELLDLQILTDNPTKEGIIGQLDTFVKEGSLTKEQRDIFGVKNVELILDFIKSDVGIRMAHAAENGKLYKEAPFMMGLPANLLKNEFPQDETVLIQGIIDAYWEENGEYIILDYKTDRVTSAVELIDRYKAQLYYYEEALEKMHMHVKEKLIYSFALGEIIRL